MWSVIRLLCLYQSSSWWMIFHCSFNFKLIISNLKPWYFIFYEQAVSFVIVLFVVTFYMLRKISFCLWCGANLCVCLSYVFFFFMFVHTGKLDFYIIEFIDLLKLLDFMSYSERLYFLWVTQYSIFLLQCYGFFVI